MQRLEEQLAKANKLIADGTKAIVKLQAEIRRLQRERKDTFRARSLLGQYQARAPHGTSQDLGVPIERGQAGKSAPGDITPGGRLGPGGQAQDTLSIVLP